MLEHKELFYYSVTIPSVFLLSHDSSLNAEKKNQDREQAVYYLVVEEEGIWERGIGEGGFLRR